MARVRELALDFVQPARELNDLREALVLAAERRQQLRVAERLGVEQVALDVSRPSDRLGETVAETQLFFSYFCRKRSTRPAVSTSFCLPVKNGWQFEQISV